MKKKQIPNSPLDDKETPKEIDNENEIPLEDGSDICQQLMDRYSKSSAPQHRHLMATAAAMRSILSSESLPLSPPAYFAASISALDDDSAATLDSTAIGALLTFLSLVVPAVPKGGIASGKAKEAVEVVVRVLGKEGLGVASLRSGDWHSVQFGLESLLGFAIDKRPKVRRCAQEYLEKFFKSSQSSDVMKEATLLSSEASVASHASDIMKELITDHIDLKSLSSDNNGLGSEEADALKSICSIFENTLSSSDGIPNEHVLAVLTVLFQKLGESSYIFMKGIVHKLADLMTRISGNTSNTNHLQNCVGSAVTVIGPERILTLLPITLSVDNFMHSNMWLVSILKDYVVGASLSYYMEHIVPLAKSFQEASCKVKKSVIRQDLQAHSHSLWGLLPAFCRYSIDTHKRFKALAELLIDILKEDSLMHENIAVAIQILVNQNKNILRSGEDADESNNTVMGDSKLELRIPDTYSKKTATKNIKALSSCAPEILQALTDVFIHSIPAKRLYLKDAIGCLASITDSSITKRIFVLLVEKLQSIDGEGEFVKQADNADEVVEKEKNTNTMGKDASRCIIMELASSLISGAEEDLIDFIYVLIKQTFQVSSLEENTKPFLILNEIIVTLKDVRAPPKKFNHLLFFSLYFMG
ncbi:RRP12-like protein [Gossypium arboreum]|uniref:RRP12-like protein n=1 Tax=Gossypium arboreum TaxID=29729 RepID=A0A0B0N7K0_GOSAR|nr:RRP12-like protein [Gossypium arboreum]